MFSSDGHWVAYDSNESGKEEIYAVAFPNATARFQISTAGGANAMAQTAVVLHRPDNKIMAVDISSLGDSLQVGTPTCCGSHVCSLVVNPPTPPAPMVSGSLVNELLLQSTAQLTLVLNWDAELKK
jgi:hypothetical protein